MWFMCIYFNLTPQKMEYWNPTEIVVNSLSILLGFFNVTVKINNCKKNDIDPL